MGCRAKSHCRRCAFDLLCTRAACGAAWALARGTPSDCASPWSGYLCCADVGFALATTIWWSIGNDAALRRAPPRCYAREGVSTEQPRTSRRGCQLHVHNVLPFRDYIWGRIAGPFPVPEFGRHNINIQVATKFWDWKLSQNETHFVSRTGRPPRRVDCIGAEQCLGVGKLIVVQLRGGCSAARAAAFTYKRGRDSSMFVPGWWAGKRVLDKG